MKKKIKQHVFVDDAFGIIPIVTLQHPTKEAMDAYYLGEGLEKEIELLCKFQNLVDNYIYVTAIIEYKKVKKTRRITKLEIQKIEIFE